MNSLREGLFLAHVPSVTEEEVQSINAMQRVREELICRLKNIQLVQPKGWRQTVIELLIPATSLYDFRKTAMGLLMVCPEALDSVVDAAYIFKHERGGFLLIKQVDEVRKNLKRYKDPEQRKWFLRRTLGIRRKPRRFAIRAVS